MMSALRREGEWPGRVKLQWLFMLAHLRPWDDDADAATISVAYGTGGFASRCVRFALEMAPAVRSGVVPPHRYGVWEERGFRPELELMVMECPLSAAIVETRVEGTTPYSGPIGDLVEMDNAAFDKPWRIGRLGLEDSVATTPRSSVHVVEENEKVLGYAIVGADNRTRLAYLQRIATTPDRQGEGVGSRLLAAAKSWAVTEGCEQMLLNVNPLSTDVIDFYRRHGFSEHDMKLQVFRRDRT